MPGIIFLPVFRFSAPGTGTPQHTSRRGGSDVGRYSDTDSVPSRYRKTELHPGSAAVSEWVHGVLYARVEVEKWVVERFSRILNSEIFLPLIFLPFTRHLLIKQNDDRPQPGAVLPAIFLCPWLGRAVTLSILALVVSDVEVSDQHSCHDQNKAGTTPLKKERNRHDQGCRDHQDQHATLGIPRNHKHPAHEL